MPKAITMQSMNMVRAREGEPGDVVVVVVAYKCVLVSAN